MGLDEIRIGPTDLIRGVGRKIPLLNSRKHRLFNNFRCIGRACKKILFVLLLLRMLIIATPSNF